MSNKDCRGVARGRCKSCDSCDEFLSEKGTFLCAYCSCAPAKHEIELSAENGPPEKPTNVNQGASALQGIDLFTLSNNMVLSTFLCLLHERKRLFQIFFILFWGFNKIFEHSYFPYSFNWCCLSRVSLYSLSLTTLCTIESIVRIIFSSFSFGFLWQKRFFIFYQAISFLTSHLKLSLK